MAGVNDGIVPLEFLGEADIDYGMRLDREMQERPPYIAVTRA